MTKEEILLKLEEMKARLSGLSLSDKSLIEKIQPQVLRRPFVNSGCSDCYKDAVIEMYTYLKKHSLMEKVNYLLCAGVVLHSAEEPDVYTNANLTDEIAEKYLKNNPKRIGLFASFPADWKKRAGITAGQKELSEAEKELISVLAGKLKAGATKAALKEEFREYGIDGKKVTVRALDEYINKAKENTDANAG
jgi:hypothetical protein